MGMEAWSLATRCGGWRGSFMGPWGGSQFYGPHTPLYTIDTLMGSRKGVAVSHLRHALNITGAARRDHEARKRSRTASPPSREAMTGLLKSCLMARGRGCAIFPLVDFVVCVREVGGCEAGPVVTNH